MPVVDDVTTLGGTMSNPWSPPQPSPPPQPWRQPVRQPVQQQVQQPGTTPLGTRPPARVSIDSYGPPSSKVTPAIVLAVAALSLVVGVVGYGLVGRPGTPGATATPSVTRTTEPSSTRSGGVAFEARNDSALGYWQVTSTRWNGDQLIVGVAVTVDTGQTRPAFYAFGNNDSRVYDPDAIAPPPSFGAQTIRPGQTVAGNISFRIARGPVTLVLTDSAGRQVSALPIKG